ncbi:hypothetical protein, partial [Trebonia kvetii]|uniref:hypothetical protein n=1 Tax=Trebonia kvetii TaxID=2480626 RepID=UPI001C9E63A9
MAQAARSYGCRNFGTCSFRVFELYSCKGNLKGGQAMTNAFLTNTVMVLGVFAVTFAASGWIARWLLPA